MSRKLISQFSVASESGEQFTVFEYQEFVDAGTHDDPNAAIPGMKELVLSDGSHLNMIDDRTFKIVSRNLIVRKI